MSPRRRLAALGCVVAVLLATAAMPVSSRLIRLTQLAAVAAALALVLSFGWQRRWARIAVVVALVPVAFMAAPSRALDAAKVRAAYVSELEALGGVEYVWGGEGRMGLDCSGLPRKALLDAALEQGVATGNPKLLRYAAGLWWNDLSARAIGTHHRRSTVPVTEGESIRGLDHGPLRPGDLAVTRDGKHLLVFLDGDRWIQADPVAGEVITVRAGDANQWLQVPVRVVRWRLLA